MQPTPCTYHIVEWRVINCAEILIYLSRSLSSYIFFVFRCVIRWWYQHSTLHMLSLKWRHNEHDGASNHQPHDCLLNVCSRHRSKKASMLRVTGLCEGNSPVTSEFLAKKASNADNVSIGWRHHAGNIPLNRHVASDRKIDQNVWKQRQANVLTDHHF